MKKSDITLLALELDNKVSNLAREKGLFSGGCCYLAYILAKKLEENNIQYTTKVYMPIYSGKRNFYEICRNQECFHVSININTGSETIGIGYTNYDYYVNRGFFGVAVINTNAKEIKKAYYANDWNPDYDRNNNSYVSREINKVFAKYQGL